MTKIVCRGLGSSPVHNNRVKLVEGNSEIVSKENKHWIIKGASVKTLLNNYEKILKLSILLWSLQNTKKRFWRSEFGNKGE